MSTLTASVPAGTGDRIALIRDKALWIRRHAFKMVFDAQLGHPGGDFSAADILRRCISASCVTTPRYRAPPAVTASS